MTSLAVLCRRPHSIRVYIACDPAPFTVNIIHTSVSQSFASVRDFALFVIVTVVKNDLILREVRVYLFTSEGILVHDTFSHLIDAAATVMLRKKQSMDGSIAPSILVGAQIYSK